MDLGADICLHSEIYNLKCTSEQKFKHVCFDEGEIIWINFAIMLAFRFD